MQSKEGLAGDLRCGFDLPVLQVQTPLTLVFSTPGCSSWTLLLAMGTKLESQDWSAKNTSHHFKLSKESFAQMLGDPGI